MCKEAQIQPCTAENLWKWSDDFGNAMAAMATMFGSHRVRRTAFELWLESVPESENVEDRRWTWGYNGWKKVEEQAAKNLRELHPGGDCMIPGDECE